MNTDYVPIKVGQASRLSPLSLDLSPFSLDTGILAVLYKSVACPEDGQAGRLSYFVPERISA